MTDREAMQQALEALGWTDEWRPDGLKEQAIAALRERLAQPEQEPVAWMVIGDGEYGEYTPGMHFDTVGYKEYWERRGYELQPLYTTPPQRKPLTDEEIFFIWRKHIDPDAVRYTPYEDDGIGFARAIEAAHGIKGEA